jgi:hypothetical protein
MGINEIFSIFSERLTRNKKYLRKIKISNRGELDKIIELNNIMELFFVTFYSTNSLTKRDFRMNKRSIQHTNKIYSSMTKKYTNIEMPGQYWMLHHIMPESIRYVPSYLLAAVRAAELEKKLKNHTKKLVGIRRSRKIFKKNDGGWRMEQTLI